MSGSHTNAGSYTIAVTGGTVGSNYTVVRQTGTLMVEPKALTVSATGVNKIYDGNTTATVTLSDNRVTGDVLTTGYASASFLNKDVGDGKTVNVSGITVSGTDAGNYTHNTTAATTANITPKALTVSATAKEKQWDGTTTADVKLDDNHIAGDVLTLSKAAANFDNASIGSNKTITVTGIEVTGTDAGNYTHNTTATTTANITCRQATITSVNAPSVTVGSNVAVSGTLSDSGGVTSLLANARVYVTLAPVAGGTSYTKNALATSAGCFSFTFSGVPLGSYEVSVCISGDKYGVSATWYDALAVYDPASGFATGGGWFAWPGTGEKTSFGFVTQYGKNGTNFKGNLVIVRHMADGSIYRMKSNAVTGLALSSPTGVGGWVSFSGKCTYSAPGMDTVGGYTFNMYAEDNNQPGNGYDRFWIQVINNGSIINAFTIASPAGGTGGKAVILGGGNIVIPHK